ncbi:MAG: peptidylprolyl isomerase [Candidatus Marinimicrobia bacterium]|nr:peptidylprolyl isomerase [Candidatus Neomarinimicrobiota bacterium]
MNSLLTKVLTLFMAFAASLPGQQVIDGVAAIVGERIILKSDILQLANMAAIQNRVNLLQQPGALELFQSQALESIITQYILVAQAKIDSLDDIDPEQVDQALDQQMDQIMAQVGTEENFFTAVGQTVRDFRREKWDTIRDQLIAEKFRAEKIKPVTISRPEVRAFFEAYKDSLPAIQTRAEISQLALIIEPGPESRASALVTINDLRAQLSGGADFSILASSYSEDPGSAARGGELGLVLRSELVPAFERAAFNLGPDEISDVVRSKFGYHIIQAIDKQGEKINVRHILITAKPSAQDRQLALDQVRELYFILQEEPALFDSLATGLAASSGREGEAASPYVGWVELGQLPSEAYRSALFGAKPGDITPPFETSDGFHILKIHDIKEGGPANLEGYYPQIESLALQQKQAQYLNSWLIMARKQLFIKIL